MPLLNQLAQRRALVCAYSRFQRAISSAVGSTSPIWTNGKDTRFRKIEDSEAFTNVRARAIPVAEAGK